MAWLPLPIVMGMFAGSILSYVTRLVTATMSDAAVAGTAVMAFLLGRAINNRRVPPLGFAMIAGGIAICVTGAFASVPIQWELPTIVAPEMAFSMSAIIAISLPMLILAMGLGNVQGIGFLIAQGYRVPINFSTIVVGINSVVNALFGGHPAIVARTGVAIFAAPDAGPQPGRYWASVVAASLTIVLAVAATPVMSLMGVLPQSYVFALAGLAVLSALQDAFEKAFGGGMRFGALVAFAVAATPFSIAGITSLGGRGRNAGSAYRRAGGDCRTLAQWNRPKVLLDHSVLLLRFTAPDSRRAAIAALNGQPHLLQHLVRQPGDGLRPRQEDADGDEVGDHEWQRASEYLAQGNVGPHRRDHEAVETDRRGEPFASDVSLTRVEGTQARQACAISTVRRG
jgi:hypothetical protein